MAGCMNLENGAIIRRSGSSFNKDLNNRIVISEENDVFIASNSIYDNSACTIYFRLEHGSATMK